MPHFLDYPEDHYQEPEPCPAWCIIPREPGEAPDEHVHTAARRGVACVELWRQRRYVASYGGSRGSSGSAWSGSGTSSGLSSSSASLSSVGDGHTSKTVGAGSTSDKADGSSASTGDDGINAGGSGMSGASSGSSASTTTWNTSPNPSSPSGSHHTGYSPGHYPSSSRPVIVQHHPEAVTLDIVRYRFNGETEDWIYIGDGIRGLDLSPESARRLVRVLREYVGEW